MPDMMRALKAMDTALESSPFLAGAVPTLADTCAATALFDVLTLALPPPASIGDAVLEAEAALGPSTGKGNGKGGKGKASTSAPSEHVAVLARTQNVRRWFAEMRRWSPFADACSRAGLLRGGVARVGG